MKKVALILSTVLLSLLVGCTRATDSFTVSVAEVDQLTSQLLNAIAPRTNLFSIDIPSDGQFEISVYLNLYEYGELIDSQRATTYLISGGADQNIHLFLSLPFDENENIAILLRDYGWSRFSFPLELPVTDAHVMMHWSELEQSVTETIGNPITLVSHVIHHGDSLKIPVDGGTRIDHTTTITASVRVSRTD